MTFMKKNPALLHDYEISDHSRRKRGHESRLPTPAMSVQSLHAAQLCSERSPHAQWAETATGWSQWMHD